MLKQKAEKYFRSAEGYNCAQSIFKAFQEVYSIDKEKIEAHALSGSGRAEGGLCGALFAAKKILGTVFGNNAQPFNKRGLGKTPAKPVIKAFSRAAHD